MLTFIANNNVNSNHANSNRKSALFIVIVNINIAL